MCLDVAIREQASLTSPSAVISNELLRTHNLQTTNCLKTQAPALAAAVLDADGIDPEQNLPKIGVTHRLHREIGSKRECNISPLMSQTNSIEESLSRWSLGDQDVQPTCLTGHNDLLLCTYFPR